MNSLFVILLPSVLGLKLIDHFVEKRENKKLFFDYLILVFISNLLSMITLVLLKQFNGNLIENITLYMTFATKYTLLLTVINIICAFIIIFSIKNITIKIESVKNEKRDN